MKLGFRLYVFVAALILASGTLISASAQTDSFVGQLSSSARQTFVNDMTGNGRFVVVESNGDIGTKEPALGLNPDNSDGNREIFLIDYAQRRIFQLTNTQSRLRDTALSPTLQSNILVEISNNRPVISYEGRATGTGRALYIVFSSNANSLSPAGTNTSTPANFNANNLTNADRDALLADGNQEIWIYEVPEITTEFDLSQGQEAPFVNLGAGTFTRVTNTPASRTPQGGTSMASPQVADDNRDITINDDGSLIAFVSSRNLITTPAPGTNSDGNPEIFTRVRTAPPNTFGQVTNTPPGTITSEIFNASPMLSGTGARIAYASNANIADTATNTTNNSDGNTEIYYADLDTTTGARLSNKQVTRTARANLGDILNILTSGRRISRDGNLLLLESAADLTANPSPSSSNQTSSTIFLHNIAANTFTKVGARGQEDTTLGQDVIRFPTFSDYVGLTPGAIIFASRLNFKADGTIPATASEGLNPDNVRPVQIYSQPLPLGTTLAFTRLTRIPSTGFFLATLQPFSSNSRFRITFSLALTELGTGNGDGSAEAYYLLNRPSPLADTNVAESYSTGASNRPVGPSPSPTPTPTASPTPTPVTPETVPGLSPGMLAIVRFQGRQIFPTVNSTGTSTRRIPSLPLELAGVTMSINSAAVGLYTVSSRYIVFVVPPGLIPATTGTTYPVVLNVRGRVYRGTVNLVQAQPDIFTTTDGPGGRAQVLNALNNTPEPFSVFTVRPQRPRAPTVLRIILTGVAGLTSSQITAIRIGNTDLTGTAIRSNAVITELPGFYQIDVQLPATLNDAGDVPITVTVTVNGQVYTSRLADTAPRIRIL